MLKNKLFASAVIAVTVVSATSYVSAAPLGNGSLPISALKSDAKTLAAQPSGAYDIDPNHTRVFWRLTHMGTSNYTASFTNVTGTINFDAKNVTKSSVDVNIDPSVVTTGMPNFNTEISNDFLEAPKYNTINFKSTSLVKTSATTGVLKGNLTFHGVTKPVDLIVNFNGATTNPFSKKNQLGFSARGSIKRSDFGVVKYIPLVGDQVNLIIEVEAQKK